MDKIAVLGIGNTLEHDDGFGVYATKYLELNFSFSPEISIIHGGVEGINLLSVYTEYQRLIILDTIEIDDTPGAIYHIPSNELSKLSTQNSDAHNIGVLQTLQMAELMGKKVARTSVLSIVPHTITLNIALSKNLLESFENYIHTLLKVLQDEDVQIVKKTEKVTIENIVQKFQEAKY